MKTTEMVLVKRFNLMNSSFWSFLCFSTLISDILLCAINPCLILVISQLNSMSTKFSLKRLPGWVLRQGMDQRGPVAEALWLSGLCFLS